MLYRLVAPVKRKGSSRPYFAQRIPADLRGRAVGMKLSVPVGPDIVPLTISPKSETIRLSLRTADISEAKVRQGEVAAFFETVWASLRTNEPVRLTHRQAVALSGELYRAWAEEKPGRATTLSVSLMPDGTWQEDDDTELTEPEGWQAGMNYLERMGESGDAEDLEPVLGPLVDRLLLRRGIKEVDAFSRKMVLTEFSRALQEALASRKRNTSGDYSPDPIAARFPEWDHPVSGQANGEAHKAAAKGTRPVSLTGLIEDWWREAQAAGRAVSTYESYRNTMRRFSKFLKHDEATRVTSSDVVAFKDHRLAMGISTKTVGDSDVSGLRAVFGWAVTNLKLPVNPAENIKVTRSRPVKTRSSGFTEGEASAILTQSLRYDGGRERAKTIAAKKWVPWLCAYTGARVGEMIQLRRHDVRQNGSAWIITITPEAGTVKDKEAREVVLHEHLVELGFPAFVSSSKEGHLFIEPREDGETAGVRKGMRNRLREFVRQVVKDDRVAPNHGWRHLFKTIGREAGIADSVLDGICGHAPSSIGGSYGSVTIKAQSEALARFPRFDITED